MALSKSVLRNFRKEVLSLSVRGGTTFSGRNRGRISSRSKETAPPRSSLPIPKTTPEKAALRLGATPHSPTHPRIGNGGTALRHLSVSGHSADPPPPSAPTSSLPSDVSRRRRAGPS